MFTSGQTNSAFASGSTPFDPTDTSAEAEAVHNATLKSLDGFGRLALAASLRRRAVRLLSVRYQSRAEVVAHILKAQVDAETLEIVRQMAADA